MSTHLDDVQTQPTTPVQIEYAGATWYARGLATSGEIHWLYGPRLRPGIDQALAWCGARENLPAVFVGAEVVLPNVGDGVPCVTCSRLAPLPGSVER